MEFALRKILDGVVDFGAFHVHHWGTSFVMDDVRVVIQKDSDVNKKYDEFINSNSAFGTNESDTRQRRSSFLRAANIFSLGSAQSTTSSQDNDDNNNSKNASTKEYKQQNKTNRDRNGNESPNESKTSNGIDPHMIPGLEIEDITVSKLSFDMPSPLVLFYTAASAVNSETHKTSKSNSNDSSTSAKAREPSKIPQPVDASSVSLAKDINIKLFGLRISLKVNDREKRLDEHNAFVNSAQEIERAIKRYIYLKLIQISELMAMAKLSISNKITLEQTTNQMDDFDILRGNKLPLPSTFSARFITRLINIIVSNLSIIFDDVIIDIVDYNSKESLKRNRNGAENIEDGRDHNKILGLRLKCSRLCLSNLDIEENPNLSTIVNEQQGERNQKDTDNEDICGLLLSPIEGNSSNVIRKKIECDSLCLYTFHQPLKSKMKTNMTGIQEMIISPFHTRIVVVLDLDSAAMKSYFNISENPKIQHTMMKCEICFSKIILNVNPCILHDVKHILGRISEGSERETNLQTTVEETLENECGLNNNERINCLIALYHLLSNDFLSNKTEKEETGNIIKVTTVRRYQPKQKDFYLLLSQLERFLMLYPVEQITQIMNITVDSVISSLKQKDSSHVYASSSSSSNRRGGSTLRSLLGFTDKIDTSNWKEEDNVVAREALNIASLLGLLESSTAKSNSIPIGVSPSKISKSKRDLITNEEHLKSVFCALDKDASGDLDVSELKTGLEMSGLFLSKESLANVISDFDISGDNKLSFEEFKQLVTKASNYLGSTNKPSNDVVHRPISAIALRINSITLQLSSESKMDITQKATDLPILSPSRTAGDPRHLFELSLHHICLRTAVENLHKGGISGTGKKVVEIQVAKITSSARTNLPDSDANSLEGLINSRTISNQSEERDAISGVSNMEEITIDTHFNIQQIRVPAFVIKRNHEPYCILYFEPDENAQEMKKIYFAESIVIQKSVDVKEEIWLCKMKIGTDDSNRPISHSLPMESSLFGSIIRDVVDEGNRAIKVKIQLCQRPVSENYLHQLVSRTFNKLISSQQQRKNDEFDDNIIIEKNDINIELSLLGSTFVNSKTTQEKNWKHVIHLSGQIQALLSVDAVINRIDKKPSKNTIDLVNHSKNASIRTPNEAQSLLLNARVCADVSLVKSDAAVYFNIGKTDMYLFPETYHCVKRIAESLVKVISHEDINKLPKGNSSGKYLVVFISNIILGKRARSEVEKRISETTNLIFRLWKSDHHGKRTSDVHVRVITLQRKVESFIYGEESSNFIRFQLDDEFVANSSADDASGAQNVSLCFEVLLQDQNISKDANDSLFSFVLLKTKLSLVTASEHAKNFKTVWLIDESNKHSAKLLVSFFTKNMVASDGTEQTFKGDFLGLFTYKRVNPFINAAVNNTMMPSSDSSGTYYGRYLDIKIDELSMKSASSSNHPIEEKCFYLKIEYGDNEIRSSKFSIGETKMKFIHPISFRFGPLPMNIIVHPNQSNFLYISIVETNTSNEKKIAMDQENIMAVLIYPVSALYNDYTKDSPNRDGDTSFVKIFNLWNSQQREFEIQARIEFPPFHKTIISTADDSGNDDFQPLLNPLLPAQTNIAIVANLSLPDIYLKVPPPIAPGSGTVQKFSRDIFQPKILFLQFEDINVNMRLGNTPYCPTINAIDFVKNCAGPTFPRIIQQKIDWAEEKTKDFPMHMQQKNDFFSQVSKSKEAQITDDLSSTKDRPFSTHSTNYSDNGNYHGTPMHSLSSLSDDNQIDHKEESFAKNLRISIHNSDTQTETNSKISGIKNYEIGRHDQLINIGLFLSVNGLSVDIRMGEFRTFKNRKNESWKTSTNSITSVSIRDIQLVTRVKGYIENGLNELRFLLTVDKMIWQAGDNEKRAVILEQPEGNYKESTIFDNKELRSHYSSYSRGDPEEDFKHDSDMIKNKNQLVFYIDSTESSENKTDIEKEPFPFESQVEFNGLTFYSSLGLKIGVDLGNHLQNIQKQFTLSEQLEEELVSTSESEAAATNSAPESLFYIPIRQLKLNVLIHDIKLAVSDFEENDDNVSRKKLNFAIANVLVFNIIETRLNFFSDTSTKDIDLQHGEDELLYLNSPSNEYLSARIAVAISIEDKESFMNNLIKNEKDKTMILERTELDLKSYFGKNVEDITSIIRMNSSESSDDSVQLETISLEGKDINLDWERDERRKRARNLSKGSKSMLRHSSIKLQGMELSLSLESWKTISVIANAHQKIMDEYGKQRELPEKSINLGSFYQDQKPLEAKVLNPSAKFSSEGSATSGGAELINSLSQKTLQQEKIIDLPPNIFSLLGLPLVLTNERFKDNNLPFYLQVEYELKKIKNGLDNNGKRNQIDRVDFMESFDFSISSLLAGIGSTYEGFQSPLLKIVISKVNIEGFVELSKQQFLKGWGLCSIQVSSFNSFSQNWEPLVEPWKMRMKCEKIDIDKPFVLHTHAPLRLTVNISNGLMANLQQINLFLDPEYIPQNLEDPSQSRSVAFSPNWVKNDTGSELLFWYATATRQSTSNYEKLFSLKPGETKRIPFYDKSKLRTAGQRLIHKGLRAIEHKRQNILRSRKGKRNESNYEQLAAASKFTSEQVLMLVFDRIDEDKSGGLSVYELQKALARLGEYLSINEILYEMGLVDSEGVENVKRETTVIDRNEFKKFFMPKHATLKRETSTDISIGDTNISFVFFTFASDSESKYRFQIPLDSKGTFHLQSMENDNMHAAQFSKEDVEDIATPKPQMVARITKIGVTSTSNMIILETLYRLQNRMNVSIEYKLLENEKRLENQHSLASDVASTILAPGEEVSIPFEQIGKPLFLAIRPAVISSNDSLSTTHSIETKENIASGNGGERVSSLTQKYLPSNWNFSDSFAKLGGASYSEFEILGIVSECDKKKIEEIDELVGIDNITCTSNSSEYFETHVQCVKNELSDYRFAEVLDIRIKSAKGILAADFNNLSDPYVIVKCGKDTFRTETIKKTLNPVWSNKTNFRFGESIDNPLQADGIILFQLCDADLFSFGSKKKKKMGMFDDPIGNASISVSTLKYLLFKKQRNQSSFHFSAEESKKYEQELSENIKSTEEGDLNDLNEANDYAFEGDAFMTDKNFHTSCELQIYHPKKPNQKCGKLFVEFTYYPKKLCSQPSPRVVQHLVVFYPGLLIQNLLPYTIEIVGKNSKFDKEISIIVHSGVTISAVELHSLIKDSDSDSPKNIFDRESDVKIRFIFEKNSIQSAWSSPLKNAEEPVSISYENKEIASIEFEMARNYSKYGTSRIMTFYADYWVVNKTLMAISYNNSLTRHGLAQVNENNEVFQDISMLQGPYCVSFYKKDGVAEQGSSGGKPPTISLQAHCKFNMHGEVQVMESTQISLPTAEDVALQHSVRFYFKPKDANKLKTKMINDRDPFEGIPTMNSVGNGWLIQLSRFQINDPALPNGKYYLRLHLFGNKATSDEGEMNQDTWTKITSSNDMIPCKKGEDYIRISRTLLGAISINVPYATQEFAGKQIKAHISVFTIDKAKEWTYESSVINLTPNETEYNNIQYNYLAPDDDEINELESSLNDDDNEIKSISTTVSIIPLSNKMDANAQIDSSFTSLGAVVDVNASIHLPGRSELWARTKPFCIYPKYFIANQSNVELLALPTFGDFESNIIEPLSSTLTPLYFVGKYRSTLTYQEMGVKLRLAKQGCPWTESINLSRKADFPLQLRDEDGSRFVQVWIDFNIVDTINSPCLVIRSLRAPRCIIRNISAQHQQGEYDDHDVNDSIDANASQNPGNKVWIAQIKKQDVYLTEKIKEFTHASSLFQSAAACCGGNSLLKKLITAKVASSNIKFKFDELNASNELAFALDHVEADLTKHSIDVVHEEDDKILIGENELKQKVARQKELKRISPRLFITFEDPKLRKDGYQRGYIIKIKNGNKHVVYDFTTSTQKLIEIKSEGTCIIVHISDYGTNRNNQSEKIVDMKKENKLHKSSSRLGQCIALVNEHLSKTWLKFSLYIASFGVSIATSNAKSTGEVCFLLIRRIALEASFSRETKKYKADANKSVYNKNSVKAVLTRYMLDLNIGSVQIDSSDPRSKYPVALSFKKKWEFKDVDEQLLSLYDNEDDTISSFAFSPEMRRERKKKDVIQLLLLSTNDEDGTGVEVIESLVIQVVPIDLRLDGIFIGGILSVLLTNELTPFTGSGDNNQRVFDNKSYDPSVNFIDSTAQIISNDISMLEVPGSDTTFVERAIIEKIRVKVTINIGSDKELRDVARIYGIPATTLSIVTKFSRFEDLNIDLPNSFQYSVSLSTLISRYIHRTTTAVLSQLHEILFNRAKRITMAIGLTKNLEVHERTREIPDDISPYGPGNRPWYKEQVIERHAIRLIERWWIRLKWKKLVTNLLPNDQNIIKKDKDDPKNRQGATQAASDPTT